MQNTDEQLLLEIIEQAESGNFTEFRFINYWTEFRFYSRTAKATKLIIRTLNRANKNLFKDYCKDVAVRSADVNKLLAYSKLCDIIAFYEKDLETIKRMLDDYDAYLGQGNFWYSFLGGEREYYFKDDDNTWNTR